MAPSVKSCAGAGVLKSLGNLRGLGGHVFKYQQLTGNGAVK